ncbi:hypothetical protein QQY66_02400 [Streptomyces sp. DG2A-72]|uniref:hypothetical protein n=1 Tax=Streptomyces sp. DG2A-72 TaxID=3051386 RepID=UPI00265C1706|nr:hypothetical protein [Streptomyces sp. DG2A-72]MDO0930589.1 hypothetical protein [Streptomyces sp. DG2A-72]
MCAEAATVWHNDGKGEQAIEENIQNLAGRVDAIESMRYDVVRQLSQSGEGVHQLRAQAERLTDSHRRRAEPESGRAAAGPARSAAARRRRRRRVGGRGGVRPLT